MLTIQRFESLAEQKYSSANVNIRNTAEAELAKQMDPDNSNTSKVCNLLYQVIEMSSSPWAHLEAVNIIKGIWEKNILTTDQEKQFASTTIQAILTRYNSLPQQSQVFLKELIPFTLFKHSSSWASRIIGEILKPVVTSLDTIIMSITGANTAASPQQMVKQFPSASEIILVNALIDIPKNLQISHIEAERELSSISVNSGSEGITIRKSILRVLRFAKSALMFGYLKGISSLEEDQLKMVGIDRPALDALCSLVATCTKVGKKYASTKSGGYMVMGKLLRNKLMAYTFTNCLSRDVGQDALLNAFYSTKLDNGEVEEDMSMDALDMSGINGSELAIIEEKMKDDADVNVPVYPTLLNLVSHYLSLYITQLIVKGDQSCVKPLTDLAQTLSMTAKKASNIPPEIINTYASIANKAFETMLGVSVGQISPNLNYPIEPFNPTTNNEVFTNFMTHAQEAAHELFMMTRNVFGMLNSNACNIEMLNTQLIVLLVFRMTEIIHFLLLNGDLFNMWLSGMTAYATLIKCLSDISGINRKRSRKIRSVDDINSDNMENIPLPTLPTDATPLQRVLMIFDPSPNSPTSILKCMNSSLPFPSDLSKTVPTQFIKFALTTSATYVINLFTTQYGLFIQARYTHAEQQRDYTFTLPSVGKNGSIKSSSHIEESARSPLIEDCCPNDFWYILRILPVNELITFTINAEGLIKQLLNLKMRITPEALANSSFNENEYLNVITTTVNLAWMMAIISVIMILDTTLTIEYRVRTTNAILYCIEASKIAQTILGVNSSTIKYLETTILSALRAVVNHHLNGSSSDIDLIIGIGSEFGVTGMNDSTEEATHNGVIRPVQYITKVLLFIYSTIITKLLSNVNVYQGSSLQSHSIKLLHLIIRQLPQPSENTPMLEDITNLLKIGPLHVIDSIITTTNPTTRDVRLAKGLSGVIASILKNLRDTRGVPGLNGDLAVDTLITNMLIEFYDTFVKFAQDGSNFLELIKGLIALRGFLPILIRTSEYAFIIVKMFILYCPAIDAIIENSHQLAVQSNNFTPFLCIIKFVFKMLISVLKMGINDLMDSLRSNGARTMDKNVNTTAYCSPYLHVSSLLCSFINGLVKTQMLMNSALISLSQNIASNSMVDPLVLSATIRSSCIMTDFLMGDSKSSNYSDYSFGLDMVVNESILLPYLSGTLSLIPILHDIITRTSLDPNTADIVNRKKYMHTTIITASDILARFPFIVLNNPNLDPKLIPFLYKESCSLIGIRGYSFGGSGEAMPQASNDMSSLIVGLRSLLPLCTTALHCKRNFNAMARASASVENTDMPQINLGQTGKISPQIYVFIRDCSALQPDICEKTEGFVKGMSSLLPPLTIIFKHVILILLNNGGSYGNSTETATIMTLGMLLVLAVYKFYDAKDRYNLWNVLSLGLTTYSMDNKDKLTSLIGELRVAMDDINENLRVTEADLQSVRDALYGLARHINK